MKIGDKVSFLTEKGGGIIAGFLKGNIVLVEDEDGFQIPTLASQVVVTAESADEYNRFKAPTAQKSGVDNNSDVKSVRALINGGAEKEVDIYSDIKKPLTKGKAVGDYDDDPSLGEITFQAPATERKGGDRLSAYLCFVPVNPTILTDTRFEMYLVNDCNYYLHYSLLYAEGTSWNQRSCGELEPNTKTYIEEIGREDLDSLQHIGIQMLPYKKEKSFVIKPTIDVQIRVDGVKFYKLHTFQSNKFFEQDALIYTIIENDQPARPLVVDAKQLKKEMYADANQKQKTPKKIEVRKEDDGAIIVDLHIGALLDSTQGMESADILQKQMDVFHETIQKYKKQKGTKIIFIHGKGDGILRRSIINSLNYRYKFLSYQDASFQEYGYGATQVTI